MGRVLQCKGFILKPGSHLDAHDPIMYITKKDCQLSSTKMLYSFALQTSTGFYEHMVCLNQSEHSQKHQFFGCMEWGKPSANSSHNSWFPPVSQHDIHNTQLQSANDIVQQHYTTDIIVQVLITHQHDVQHQCNEYASHL